MTQYKVVQHNADKFRLGEDYFDQHIVNCDIALLQRVPDYKIPYLKQQFPKVYYTNHSYQRSNNKTLNLVIAGPQELGEWTYTQTLPSYDKVMNSNDENQGCKALYVKLNDVVLCSVLTCYPNKTITPQDAEQDVQAVFEQCQTEQYQCLLAGDLHCEGSSAYKTMSHQYGFVKNYIENEVTFKSKQNNFINLDWCLSNSESISVNNTQVHIINTSTHGHFAITYTLGRG